MNDPKRWLDENPPEDIGRLLAAANAERPPDAALARSLAAVGIGLGAATATGAAAAGAATAKASAVLGAGALVKWSLLAGAVATGGLATLVASSPEPSTQQAMHAPASRGAAPSLRTPPIASVESPPSAPPSPPPVAAPPEQPTLQTQPATPRVRAAREVEAPIDVERLAEEVRSVDHARALVAAGRARDAIAALDDYERRFSTRRFAPEALYLRMEALLLAGERASARSVAGRLVNAYPASPQAPRARQLLAEQDP